MLIGRRSFLTGLIAAPIVVRSGLLMPVKPLIEPADITWTASSGNLSGLRWALVYGLDAHGNPICERVELPPPNDSGSRTLSSKEFRSVSHVVCTTEIPGFGPVVRTREGLDMPIGPDDTLTLRTEPMLLP